MVWKKPEEETQPSMTSQPGPAPRPSTETPRATGASIGSSIVIKGEIHGDEDLLIHGQVDGKINLRKHSVTVGREGRVKADIFGRSIRVEGQVHGNLFGESEVIIHKSGQVRGNITAPSVSLENGSKFKGAIDMEPGEDTPSGNSKSESKSESKTESASTSAKSQSSPTPDASGSKSSSSTATGATASRA